MTGDKISSFLLSGGMSPAFFRGACPLLDDANRKMLRMVTMGTLIMLGCVLGASLFVPSLRPLQQVYLIPLVIALVLFVVCRLPVVNITGAPRVIYYLWAIGVNGYAVYLGTFYSPDVPASLYFTLVVVTAALVLDRPVVPLLLSSATTLAFCVFTAQVKGGDPFLLQADLVDAMFSWMLSMFFTCFLIRTRLENLQTTQTYLQRSETDPLTGLTNKATTEYLCQMFLEQRRHTGAALLMVDVDDFKAINDKYGHAQGDAVLCKVGGCLRKCFRESDVVGRIGGDEFLVLMKNITSPQNAMVKAAQLCEEFQQMYDGASFPKLSCSVGIALIFPGDREYKKLFGRADQALYVSKVEGKNRYTLYSAANASARA